MFKVWRAMQSKNTEYRALNTENPEILKSWSSEATKLINHDA
jgi:hypothetical protein